MMMELKEKKYCCFCGKQLVLKTLSDGSTEKYCDDCDRVFFSTPSPAVIVMVTDANNVLLVRSVDWKHPYWGLISGYIKVEETAEETARREVREEVGLEITSLEFLKTYTAKDRDFLMIAFKAKTEKTFIKKSKELTDAKWFDLNEPLPMRPTSIASHIVRRVFPKITYKDLKSKKT